MAFITEQNGTSIFKTKFSAGGAFIVTLLGLAILALAERVLYDTGRLLAPPPLDYFNNINVIVVHAVVIVFFLVLAFVANISLGARKQRYAVALLPYYVVSIILALQLVMQISLYFAGHHTTVEFYTIMLALIAVSTYGMYFAQRRFIPESSDANASSQPATSLVVTAVVVFAAIFWVLYSVWGIASADPYAYPQPYQPSPAEFYPTPSTTNFISQAGQYGFFAPEALNAGLVGWWKLTENAALVGQDSAGSDNGQISGPVWTIVNNQIPNSDVQGVLDFSGINSHVEIPNSSQLDFGTGSTITLAAWIRPRTLGDLNTILVKDSTSTNPPQVNYALRAGSGPGLSKRLEFYYAGVNGEWEEYISDADVLTTNAWQHVAASYTFGQGASVKLYVNGVLVPGSWKTGGTGGDAAPAEIGGTLWIGALNDAYHVQGFDGLIADVRIYDRILAPAEISQLSGPAKLPEGTYADTTSMQHDN